MRTTTLLCATALLFMACGDAGEPDKGPTTPPAKLTIEYYEISEK